MSQRPFSVCFKLTNRKEGAQFVRANIQTLAELFLLLLGILIGMKYQSNKKKNLNGYYCLQKGSRQNNVMWLLSSYVSLFTIVNLIYIFIVLLKDSRFLHLFLTLPIERGRFSCICRSAHFWFCRRIITE